MGTKRIIILLLLLSITITACGSSANPGVRLTKKYLQAILDNDAQLAASYMGGGRDPMIDAEWDMRALPSCLVNSYTYELSEGFDGDYVDVYYGTRLILQQKYVKIGGNLYIERSVGKRGVSDICD